MEKLGAAHTCSLLAAMRGRAMLLVMLALFVPVGEGQINNQPISTSTFYLDNNADCNGPMRLINGQSVRVRGHGTTQQQDPPQSCTLILKSEANFKYTSLRLSVLAAKIKNCNVHMTVFDGDPGQGTLKRYDCRTPAMPNERDFLTTGDTVSFVLTRGNAINSNLDIDIVIKPLK